MNIYVGNLSAGVTDDELGREFRAFGDVTSVTFVRGRDFGDLTGHGFVDMPSSLEGTAAIAALNGNTFRNRRIDVIQALPLSPGR